MPINPLGAGTHPLRAMHVFEAAGITPANDEQMFATCPGCNQEQPLSDAELRPADDAHNITDYWCCNGCAKLITIGHAGPIPLPDSGRYRLNNFVVQPLVPGGLVKRSASGAVRFP